MKHLKSYRGSPAGGGQAVCSCGWESPVVDEGTNFTLGRKAKSVDSYFDDHLESVTATGVETTMQKPAETAVAPAQRPLARLRDAVKRKR